MMIHKVLMPKFGANIENYTIILWDVNEGDKVKKGDILCEVESAKAAFELESEYEGFLIKILVEEGESVDANQPLALISKDLKADVSTIIDTLVEKPVGMHQKEIRSQWYDKECGIDDLRDDIKILPSARKKIEAHAIPIQNVFSFSGGDIITEDVVDKFLKKPKVLIYGANLAAKQALEILSVDQEYNLIGFLDADKDLHGTNVSGYPVFGDIDFISELFPSKIDGIILAEHQILRRKIHQRIKRHFPDLSMYSLIDSRATISKSAAIGESVFIEAGAIIGPGTRIGDNVIIDSGVVVSHDCFIGPHTHLSVGCHLAGIVHLEENVLVSVGAAINSAVRIGRNVVVTPGSAVMNDIEDDVIISGCPAQVIGKSKRGSE